MLLAKVSAAHHREVQDRRSGAFLEDVARNVDSYAPIMFMKRLVNQPAGLYRKSWWLEITTESPRCEYYFGPFESEGEVLQAQSGFVEDLEQEGSKLFRVAIAYRHSPAALTVEYPEVEYPKAV